MCKSMSRWRTKTSKLGGLPNCTCEPRKPVSLGTMIKNFTECESGIIVCNDAAQNLEIQHGKKHSKDKSKLPDGSKILVHAVELLMQAEGAGLEIDGWVGADY